MNDFDHVHSFAFVEYESRRDADDAYHEMHNKRIGRDDLLKIEVSRSFVSVSKIRADRPQWARTPPSASWRFDSGEDRRSGGRDDRRGPPRRDRSPRRRSLSPRRSRDDYSPRKDDRRERDYDRRDRVISRSPDDRDREMKDVDRRRDDDEREPDDERNGDERKGETPFCTEWRPRLMINAQLTSMSSTPRSRGLKLPLCNNLVVTTLALTLQHTSISWKRWMSGLGSKLGCLAEHLFVQIFEDTNKLWNQVSLNMMALACSSIGLRYFESDFESILPNDDPSFPFPLCRVETGDRRS